MLAAVAVAVVVAAIAVIATGGGGDERVASTPSSTSTTTPRTSTSASSTTSTSSSTTTTAEPTNVSPPPPPPARPVAVDQARLDGLLLPDGSCAEWVDADLSRQLVGGESRTENQLIRLIDWAAGDLDGDGVGDAVTRIDCSSGSAYDMEAIAVLAASTTPHRIDVQRLVPSRYEPILWPFEIADGVLHVDVSTTIESDAHCCPSIDTKLAFVLEGDEFVLISATVQDSASMTEQLLAAVNAADDEAVAALATPEVAAALITLRSTGGDLGMAEPPQCDDREGADLAACTILAADGSSARLWWRRVDFFVRWADRLDRPA